MPTFKTEALRLVSNVQLVKGPLLQIKQQYSITLACPFLTAANQRCASFLRLCPLVISISIASGIQTN